MIFRLRGSTKCLGVQFFEGRNEILPLGKALKFGEIFQKYALKLIKIRKIIEKIPEKMQNFRAGHNLLIMGQISNIIWTVYNGWFGGGAPEGRKF